MISSFFHVAVNQMARYHKHVPARPVIGPGTPKFMYVLLGLVIAATVAVLLLAMSVDGSTDLETLNRIAESAEVN